MRGVPGTLSPKALCAVREVTSVDEVESFLADVLPRLRAEEIALHNGDPTDRIAVWSHIEPVTLFGAAVTKIGWEGIRATFEWLGTRFSNCEDFTIEVVAAGVSGDLGYLAAIERTTTSADGQPPAPYALRATTIFRREAGSWHVVHRHGDSFPDDAETVAALRHGDAAAAPAQ